MNFEEIIDLAEAGNTDAMVAAIQEFVWSEHISIEIDENIMEKIAEYLDRAIQAGNIDAVNQLAAMYAEGRIVDKNPKQAFILYKKASEKGHVLATCNLGFCYMYGNGTEQNYEEAFKAFSKAASLDDGDAIVRLGDMYMNGWYVSKDLSMAFCCYEKARRLAIRNLKDLGMQQVYSDTVYRLGNCYFEGIGVEKDVYMAIKYYGDALYYFNLREKKGDSYSAKGYQQTLNRLTEALSCISH